MKRVTITLKTSKGTGEVSFTKFITKEYMTDAAILKFGFPLNTEFDFIQNGVMSNYKEEALILYPNDTVELIVKEDEN